MSRSILSTVLVPINRAGWPFIGLFAVFTLGLYFVIPALGLIGALLTLWCIYFFRDPERMTPTRQGLIVSPADGFVQSIGPAVPPEELGMGAKTLTRVSVFMNVFDVHVNRIPVDGTISCRAYRPGKFVNASLDKASEHNERNGLVIDATEGFQIGVGSNRRTGRSPHSLSRKRWTGRASRRTVRYDPFRQPCRYLLAGRCRAPGFCRPAQPRRRNRDSRRSRPGIGARSRAALRTRKWRRGARG